jgi:transposase
MAKERTTVKKIKEVLRLAAVAGVSDRKISKITGVSRPVVGDIRAKAFARQLAFKDLETLTDEEIERLFYHAPTITESDRFRLLSDRFQEISRELSRTGVTLRQLWSEYRRDFPQGFGYSQYCFYYQSWREKMDVSAPLEHRPGEKMFTDFAGMTFPYYNALTGEKKQAQVFVAILPNSQYLYVEAAESQKTAECARLHENAFWFFGGVPAAIVPDNLKPVVNKPCRFEPEINRAFGLFVEYYGVSVVPARVRKPRDKALVENAVQRVYENIFAPLRNERFFSIDAVNIAFRRELERLLGKTMKRYGLSRRALFEQYEKASLHELPAGRYIWKDHAKGYAQYNYHLFFSEDKHYYSVPWRLAKQSVDVYFTVKTIEIYHRGRRVACHLRSKRFNGYTTIPEHMPEKHRAMGEWNPERFINWAKECGENVERMVRAILQSGRYHEQNFNSCMGLLRLGRKFGSVNRLNKACARAMCHRSIGYRVVKEILEKGYEDLPDEQGLFEDIPAIEHSNVRGADYYADTGL